MLPKKLNGHLGAMVLCAVASASPAFAQGPGTRAAGMAGAFVAVADDASSVYWNPAGMATGALASAVLDFGRQESIPNSERAETSSAGLVAVTLPPLGVSFYRRAHRFAPAGGTVATAGPSREDGGRSVQGLTTSNVGVTLAQSLSDNLVLASTIRLVRGEAWRGLVAGDTAEAALGQVTSLPGTGTTRVDVDAGLMLVAGRLRLGAVARNLTAPSFETASGADPVVLDREARVGVAWGSGFPGYARVVLSADADLTTQTTASGDRRDLAAGVETWWLARRLGVRGGLRRSTTGEARAVAAAGLSVALRQGMYAEAHVARGSRDQRAWGMGVRVTY
jgi:hypothetical protein